MENFPTHETEQCWIYCFNRENAIAQASGLASAGQGKWMLFYQPEEINTKWNMLKNMYAENKLKGVVSMKVSTARPNPRSSSHHYAVMLYTQGTDDQLLITGRAIANTIGYQSPIESNGYMFYKTDNMTALGTRATGRYLNHKMSIYVGKMEYPIDSSSIIHE